LEAVMLFVLPSSKRQSKTGNQVWMPREESKKLLECFGVGGYALPLYRRFKNGFWDGLEFWVLPPPVQKRIVENSLILCPLLGLARVDEPIPHYSFGWGDECNGVKVKEYWQIKERTRETLKDKEVVLFVGKRELALLDTSLARRVVRFEYYRKGKKLKNDQRHKAYTLRYIAEWNLKLEDFNRINFFDYKVADVVEKGKSMIFILHGEGRYI